MDDVRKGNECTSSAVAVRISGPGEDAEHDMNDGEGHGISRGGGENVVVTLQDINGGIVRVVCCKDGKELDQRRHDSVADADGHS